MATILIKIVKMILIKIVFETIVNLKETNIVCYIYVLYNIVVNIISKYKYKYKYKYNIEYKNLYDTFHPNQ
jgi:hypothetical protein